MYSELDTRAALRVEHHLLVADDGLLLKLGRRVHTAHLLDNLLLKFKLVEDLTAEGEIAGELAQVEAGDGLVPIFSCLVLDYINEDANQVKVVLLVEAQEVFLPELLGVDGTPPQVGLLADLLPELEDGGESLLILIQELEELVEELADVIVNPVAILQLDGKVEDSDVRHDFMAPVAGSLQVVEEE